MTTAAAWPARVRDFVRLGRPLFLAGGFLMHALGAAMAVAAGVELSVPILLWGQVAITATQLMTHYSNDYFDLEADRANQTPTPWSGGSRVLPDGLLPPHVALVAAVILTGVALAAALVLAFVLRTGPWTLPLIAMTLALAWCYSAPPIHLHSRGLGELTTALLVAVSAPLLGFYLQTGRLELVPVLAVVPLACLQFDMLLCVEFPDAAGDAAAGKRNLVVRLGARRAARLYCAVLLATYLLLPVLVGAGLPVLVALAVVAIAPLALWLGRQMQQGAWGDLTRWGAMCFWGIGLLMGTGAAELLAFLVLARLGPLTPRV
jgi:1,4-dihydroxy-2-naphthoate octaprenyltransferase